jgi:hypothetical protein
MLAYSFIHGICKRENVLMSIGCHGYAGKESSMCFVFLENVSMFSMPFETTSAICSVLMGGVLKKYPKIRLVFAHGKSLETIKSFEFTFLFFRWWIFSIYSRSY